MFSSLRNLVNSLHEKLERFEYTLKISYKNDLQKLREDGDALKARLESVEKKLGLSWVAKKIEEVVIPAQHVTVPPIPQPTPAQHVTVPPIPQPTPAPLAAPAVAPTIAAS